MGGGGRFSTTARLKGRTTHQPTRTVRVMDVALAGTTGDVAAAVVVSPGPARAPASIPPPLVPALTSGVPAGIESSIPIVPGRVTVPEVPTRVRGRRAGLEGEGGASGELAAGVAAAMREAAARAIVTALTMPACPRRLRGLALFWMGSKA